jgi:hypothetical protein
MSELEFLEDCKKLSYLNKEIDRRNDKRDPKTIKINMKKSNKENPKETGLKSPFPNTS